MKIIDIHSEISNPNDWGLAIDGVSIDSVVSLQTIKDIIESEENADEQEYMLNIHCPGGEVDEGLAIYDYLRTSGKTIYTNIEGGCHSMAVVLLLAAPKENRSANPNATALIHKVVGGAYGNAEDLADMYEEMQTLQDRIINIYVDRTNLTEEEAKDVISQEKKWGVEDLLRFGFISKVNAYNTNIYRNSMKKKQKNALTLAERTALFFNKVKNRGKDKVKNFDFVNEEGEVLFSTEIDTDALEVGMKATPDGVFTLTDGRVVTIENGEITLIEEQSGEVNVEELTEQVAELEKENEELKEENEELKEENEELEEALEEATNLINEYKKNTASNYQPKNRVGRVSKTATPTSAERKAQVKEKLKK